MKLIEIQNKLKKAGLKVFTTSEFQRVTGMSATGSRKFLLRYTRLELIWQIRRGLYAMRNEELHPWIVANKLYRPSYISMETALSYHGMIPETIYSVTSVTTKITREFTACETVFLYHTIKYDAYTGYAPLDIEGDTILIAEPEKALADYLYFVHLGKKDLNERLNCKGIKKQAFWNYLKLFNRKHLLDWSRHVIT